MSDADTYQFFTWVGIGGAALDRGMRNCEHSSAEVGAVNSWQDIREEMRRDMDAYERAIAVVEAKILTGERWPGQMHATVAILEIMGCVHDQARLS